MKDREEVPELLGVEFRDHERAAKNYALVAVRVPKNVLQALPALLAESPDPDTALNLLERLTAVGEPELRHHFARQPFLVHYAIAVFGYSPWLGETLIQNRDLFHSLARERHLEISHSRESYAESFARFRSRASEGDSSLLLARFKKREYIRIMLRDVLGVATLAETTAEISALTDVLVEEALRDADMALRNRYGPPEHVDSDGRLIGTRFAVLSMGKLGGNELNYSSDIDLMFIHGDGQEPESAAISNHEYFVRLAQHTTEILSRMTKEGAPFRIDLRLRPQGGEGDPAVGLSHALEYYGRKAADWELQALIKVRHSAGDQALARQFIRSVQPFVYTETVNFSAIETALQSREKMLNRRRMSASHRTTDVKTDRGGIRGIEFLVQCLQRVYGGKELWLRSGGTLFSLQKLHDKSHITSSEFQQLTTAYTFLRNIEHRLQLRNGQQTHRIPASAHELLVLERSVVTAQGEAIVPGTLSERIRDRMAEVAEIYQRIIHHQQYRKTSAGKGDEFRLVSAPNLVGGQHEHRQVLERLGAELPDLYQLAQRKHLAPHARRNLLRFLAACFASQERYRVLRQNSGAVESALDVFTSSEYLTDLLVRHPELISMVSQPGRLREEESAALFGPEISTNEESHGMNRAANWPGPYEEKLAFLRKLFRERAFAIGVGDLLYKRGVFESLAETSRLQEEAIRAALGISGATAGLAVLALGRLGTGEADLLSDADLIFVRHENTDPVEATRRVEQIVEVLSAYTREGAVLSVDTRLRPNGTQGELVVTPAYLCKYFADTAQSWEALTYTKLRPVAGEEELYREVDLATAQLFGRYRSTPDLPAQVREMRVRLEKSAQESRDLKAGSGGAYDIDFIVGFLLLKHGMGGRRGNLRDSLVGLGRRGLLTVEQTEKLVGAAELLRTVEHAIRLVLGKSRKTLPTAGATRQAIQAHVSRALGSNGYQDLDAMLQRTFFTVRELYNRIIV